MATSRPCLAQLSRLCLSQPPPSSSYTSIRTLSSTAPLSKGFKPKIESKKDKAALAPSQNQKYKKKNVSETKKKKARTTFLQYDLQDLEKFSLCDAMRYIRAYEVGQAPASIKYDIAVKLKSQKNGPVIRNRLQLPHPVKTDVRICVICAPDSPYAEKSRAAGATLVGEDDIIEAVKDGKIEFERCLCQTDSLAKINKAGLGRILGPRGLMPSSKLGTVVKDPSLVIKDLIGGAEYRERMGVVRVAIGQLGFTPEEVQRNVKSFMEALKKDIGVLSDRVHKEVAEVVLSSTNGPGITLNGNFLDVDSEITPKDLSSG